MPDADTSIRQAIATRHLLRFHYRGAERIAEPHDYGILTGRPRLLAYQTGGRSSSPLPGWRTFDVDEMTHVVMLDNVFPGSRNQPGSAHKRWDVLFCRVS